MSRAPVDNAQSAEPLAVARYIGHTIKEIRLRFNLTIAELGERAGISRGMLSKIENAQTLPGLDSLFRIADALGVSMSSLFKTFDTREQDAQHVRKGAEPEVLRPGSKYGHRYRLLARDPGSRKAFEPFIVEMDAQSTAFTFFEHEGVELIHMLEGCVEYRHGQHTYVLEAGDSLTFTSKVPHGPERLLRTPIRFLCVMVHPE